ncbi:MAG: glycosyltransferase [Thaumarchaeota archaeon]|nr:glycosyltransferase [Nitrososphaerota archaeon]
MNSQQHEAPRLPVSVVIPTHNRPDKLRRLLSSLQEFNGGVLNTVIIVDDSASPLELESEFPGLSLRHIVSRGRIFISRAKNIGWRAALTDFVYFIDDDNVIAEGTLPLVYEELSNLPRVGAIMPAVLYWNSQNLVWVYATPFLNRRRVLNLVGRNLLRDPSLEGRLLKTDALPNASLVRRQALEEVGGFDERLVVNSSLDFAQRLKSKGWGVYAFTGAHTFHDVDVPGKIGWWASHGTVDPERVRYELRDWFVITKRLHPRDPLFRVRYSVASLRFVLPNLLAYILRGKGRRALLGSLIRGYAEGLMLSSKV